MTGTRLILWFAVLAPLAVGCQLPRSGGDPSFTVVEADIATLQAAMTEGRTTSRAIVEEYLQRIGMYDARLRATMAVNPNALAHADRLDRERAQARPDLQLVFGELRRLAAQEQDHRRRQQRDSEQQGEWAEFAGHGSVGLLTDTRPPRFAYRRCGRIPVCAPAGSG